MLRPFQYCRCRPKRLVLPPELLPAGVATPRSQALQLEEQHSTAVRFPCRILLVGLLLVGLLLVGLFQPASAQSVIPSRPMRAEASAARSAKGQLQRPGLIRYSSARGDSLVEASFLDMNEELALIIQFQTAPEEFRLQAESGGSGTVTPQGATIQVRIESEQNCFRADLSRILSAGAPLGIPSQQVQTARSSRAIRAEYRRLLNAVAVSVPRWAVGEIQSLAYVQSVSADRPVRAQDAQANHLIGADTLGARLGLTGRGVRLGFLDSGLDYTLPELGAGFGPGFRVQGGWDYVNNDADPADDNGHGTQVASLAAAAGDALSSRGVAPEAVLFAYKVLDAKCEGLSSSVILALERALADSLDILNLSLGAAGGDPSDPLSQAVDQLSAHGVLCVAAAGNGGPAYQTILSPGCARAALTVGASDLSDHLADFSGRGPTDLAYMLKPDLLAPGVGLTTLSLGGATAEATGTSFAAPLATGAAALLKELHRGWTAEMLKSALVAGARDLGHDLWSQGAGRLDVLKASECEVLILPQSLSLGLDDLTVPEWARSDTLTLVNLSGSAQSYQIQLPQGLPQGIVLRATPPAELTIPARGRGTLIIRTVVSNALVQIPSTNPPAVTGLVGLKGATDTLSVPFALLLGSYIDLEISSTLNSPVVWFAHTDGTVYRSTESNGVTYRDGRHTVRRLLKPGVYDICAQLGYVSPGLTWLLRDSVMVNPAVKVTMDQNEAIYTVGTVPKDEFGQRLDSTLFMEYNARIYSGRTGCSFGSSYWASYYGIIQFLNRLPKISSNFIYDYCAASDPDLTKVYSYAGRLERVGGDHIVEIKTGDLTKRTIDYRFHRLVDKMASVDYFAFEGQILGIGSYSPQHATALAAPYHQEWFSTGEPVENFPYNQWYLNFRQLFSYAGIPPFHPEPSSYLMLIPNQHPGTDGVLRSSLTFSKGPALETRGSKIIYGLGPRFYYGRTANTASMFKVKTNTWVGMAEQVESFSEPYLPFFVNQAMDFTPGSLSYRLFGGQGQFISSGTTPEGFWHELTPDGRYNDYSLVVGLPSAGHYSLEVTDTASWVMNQRGEARVLLTVDTQGQDKNPPSMAAFTILADGEHADQILPGQVGELRVVVTDQEGILQEVELYAQSAADTLWQQLPLTQEGPGGAYINRDLERLPDGYISLRLVATDHVGNTLDYQAEPAFYHGTLQNHAPRPARLLCPGGQDSIQLYSPMRPVRFSWQEAKDPDLDTLVYSLHLWGGGAAIDTTISGLQDTTLKLLGPSLEPGRLYSWTVAVSDGKLTVNADTARFRTRDIILAVKETEKKELPKAFALSQNYPNPFNPTTTIRYALPVRSQVSLRVFNMLGQEVAELARGEVEAGYHEARFDASRLASGMYLCRFEAGSWVQVRKLAVVR